MPFDREYVFAAIDSLAARHSRGENVTAPVMMIVFLAGSRGVLAAKDAEAIGARFQTLPNG